MFGFGVGLGVAMWRNLPADAGAHRQSVALLLAVFVAVSFAVGWRWGRPGNLAMAVAHAEAVAVASASAAGGDARADARQVVVVNLGADELARLVETGVATPLPAPVVAAVSGDADVSTGLPVQVVALGAASTVPGHVDGSPVDSAVTALHDLAAGLVASPAQQGLPGRVPLAGGPGAPDGWAPIDPTPSPVASAADVELPALGSAVSS